MTREYLRPAELYDGLRLHQNENTGGCSPRVLEALHRLRPDQIGFYPAYAPLTEQCARHLGVTPERLLFTNGLDEGILALAIACLRPSEHCLHPEALIPEPAFEIYRVDTEVVGGRVVQVPPRPDFQFALPGVLAAMTDETRLVFLTNPSNPAGQLMPRDAIREIARQAPAEALVFLDEAYHEFAGENFLAELDDYPNIVIGRTFSKAYGLAALRIGCLLGAPDVLDRIRPIVPVYSVNVCAVAALQVALDDTAFLNDYLRQVAESKRRLYAACDRLGLRYWPSQANFVLIDARDRAGWLVTELTRRGIYIRDRSSEPGCAGCVRIATGIVEHTDACITAMEDLLCAAR